MTSECDCLTPAEPGPGEERDQGSGTRVLVLGGIDEETNLVGVEEQHLPVRFLRHTFMPTVGLRAMSSSWTA